jgi:RNA polymerase sigma-70 factor (ECF subfamily)
MCSATGQIIITEPKDREQFLIERAQAGDRYAFEELIYKCDRQILRFILRMLRDRDDARDAYQETFLKAFRSIGRFRCQSSFHTWVLRIATNVCFDRLRERQKSSQECSIDATTRAESGMPLKETLRDANRYRDPEKSASLAEVRERINRALDTLSKKERLIFELKHYQGLRLKQIGELLGSAENSVKHHLWRATQKLRVELAGLWPSC